MLVKGLEPVRNSACVPQWEKTRSEREGYGNSKAVGPYDAVTEITNQDSLDLVMKGSVYDATHATEHLHAKSLELE